MKSQFKALEHLEARCSDQNTVALEEGIRGRDEHIRKLEAMLRGRDAGIKKPVAQDG